jgi:hypothetical protein
MSDLIEGYDRLFADHDVVSMPRDHWNTIRGEIRRLSMLLWRPPHYPEVPSPTSPTPSMEAGGAEMRSDAQELVSGVVP